MSVMTIGDISSFYISKITVRANTFPLFEKAVRLIMIIRHRARRLFIVLSDSTAYRHQIGRWLLDAFTVPMHSSNDRLMPVVKAVQWDSQWPLKNCGHFHRSRKHTVTGDNPNLYLDHLIAKVWCQPIGGHVSFPPDSPNTTRLGLCSSLADCRPESTPRAPASEG